jgi:hypothetical protein
LNEIHSAVAKRAPQMDDDAAAAAADDHGCRYVIAAKNGKIYAKEVVFTVQNFHSISNFFLSLNQME